MKVIDNEIGEIGLSRLLVNDGCGDLRVKIGDVEIMCVRSILLRANSTLRKLLLDEKVGEVLELYAGCEMSSFLEIEKYYSGGYMEISENNICDILRFSVYYNDNRLMIICKKYIKTHVNDSIMIEIFSILNRSNINELNELREISENQLILNGYKYLREDEMLLKLNIDCLKLILSKSKLIMKNENWLLNRLMYWYNKILKVKKNEEEEELKEFRDLIKVNININEIGKDEISEDYLNELKELKISIDDNQNPNNHIYVNLDIINNNELKEKIYEYYTKEEEEENEVKLNEREIEKLKNEEVKNEMINILYNDDIKLIEIVLNIIMEMRISEIIPKEIKSDLILKLVHEYKKYKRNLTTKCLCLFIDDRDNILIIEKLCGKEILYEILNKENYLHSNSKELLMEYIKEMKLSLEEEEEMGRIIENQELLKEIKPKEITFFSYPHSEYSIGINEEILIIPSFDGNRCEFSTNPPLPDGIKIGKKNGIINGKVGKIDEKKEYEIFCKNRINEKRIKISLEFLLGLFTNQNKSDGISISNNGKLITNIYDSWSHCFLNLKMENGIYHIKYQFHQNGSNDDSITFGLSTDNTYSGNEIWNQPTVCEYWARDGKSQDNIDYCHIGTIVNENPNFNNHGDGSIYEMIVDMNKREFWISHNNSSPILLVKDLPSPLYPYAAIGKNLNKSIELLSFSHQSK